MRLIAVPLILLAVLGVLPQKKATTPKSQAKTDSAPKPELENVYYQSWDQGEVKWCSTYSGERSLLVCDDTKMDWKESFINLVGDKAATGMSKEESYHEALNYIRTHSKDFMVSFSEDPWPKPQAGLKLAKWNCSKDKTITCILSSREK